MITLELHKKWWTAHIGFQKTDVLTTDTMRIRQRGLEMVLVGSAAISIEGEPEPMSLF